MGGCPPGVNHENVAALLDETKLLKRKRRCAKLLLEQSNRPAYAARGNAVLRQTLDAAKGHQIAKTVEAFAPSGLRPDQL